MKALIIDDELLARRRILNLLKEIPEIEVLGEISTGRAAIKQINELKPGLIFLDINMKDMNGFEVLTKINTDVKPVVIFVTAHDNYASRAFDVEAFDFLLKPFKDDRFFRTVKKVLKINQTEINHNFDLRLKEMLEIYSEGTARKLNPVKIPVKQGNKTILLEPVDILYITASGYYAEIFTMNKKYVLRESLNNLEELLDHELFFRVHRSTIVNINHIKEIVHSGFSEIDAKMVDEKLLHVSKSNKKSFLEKIGMYK